MTRFLVGLDDSAAAATAVRWAAELADANGAEILAVHACEPAEPAEPDGADRAAQLRAAEASLTSARRWVREAGQARSVDIGLDVRQGDAREVLCAVSDVVQPDLVVLGRGGDRIGAGHEHLGRVADYTARHIARPLAVVPVGSRHHSPRVVLGVDGSAGAGEAAEWCARYLAAVGAHVIAIDVDEVPDVPERRLCDVDERARIGAELERWTRSITDAGISVEHVPLLHQYPADALVHLADSRHADIVVVGTRGRGGFEGLAVGGTALNLLRRVRVPLVLVPPWSDARSAPGVTSVRR